LAGKRGAEGGTGAEKGRGWRGVGLAGVVGRKVRKVAGVSINRNQLFGGFEKRNVLSRKLLVQLHSNYKPQCSAATIFQGEHGEQQIGFLGAFNGIASNAIFPYFDFDSIQDVVDARPPALLLLSW